MPTSNQFCWSLLGKELNKSSAPAFAAVFFGVFSGTLCFIHLPHCMAVMSGLGSLIGWAVFTRSAWTVQLNSGFEREREISGDSSLATMLLLYIISSPAMISIDLKFHEIRLKKPKKCGCIWKMEKMIFYDQVCSTSYRRFNALQKAERRQSSHMEEISRNKLPLDKSQ